MLAVVDLFVLVAYLVLVVLLGTWIGRGSRDLNTYLLGNRDLPWWAILGSIVASETSTATFLSIPGVAFAAGGDLRFLQITFGYIVGRGLIVGFLLPLYFHARLFTAYEVVHRRFGSRAKNAASLIFLVTRNMGDGLRLFLAAIALEEVLGWSLPVSVVIIGVATIAYTVRGGIKSVIWNDCLQMVIYILGGVIALSVIVRRIPGGWSSIVEFGAAQDKFRVFDFSWNLEDPFTFWAGLIGGMFLTLGTHGTDQMLVQRYLSARSRADASRALALSGFVVMGQFALFLLLGVALAAYFDLFPSGVLDRSDRVFARFIVNELPQNVGLVGLLLASVFAAAMSTLSSSLNSSATSFVNDLYRPGKMHDASQQDLVGLTRRATIVFGLCQMAIAVAASRLSGAVVSNALSIAGFASGLLVGVFALGSFTERVDERSCLIALGFGLTVLSSVQFLVPTLIGFALAWPWLPVVGACSTFAAGYAASWVQPRS